MPVTNFYCRWMISAFFCNYCSKRNDIMVKTLLSKTENGSKSKKLEGEFCFFWSFNYFISIKLNLIHILKYNSTLNDRASFTASRDSLSFEVCPFTPKSCILLISQSELRYKTLQKNELQNTKLEEPRQYCPVLVSWYMSDGFLQPWGTFSRWAMEQSALPAVPANLAGAKSSTSRKVSNTFTEGSQSCLNHLMIEQEPGCVFWPQICWEGWCSGCVPGTHIATLVLS